MKVMKTMDKKEKKKPTLIEAIIKSDIFLVIGEEGYLRNLQDRNSQISAQAKMAKKLNKPVIMLIDKNMPGDKKLELERYFAGYNVIKVRELDLNNESSWLEVKDELSRAFKVAQTNRVLTQTDFIRIYLDKEHYYYSFEHDPVEICIEPCAGGFCVAPYSLAPHPLDKEMLEPRKCTNCDGYLSSAQAIFGERREDTWNKALVIANELYRRFVLEIKNGEKEECST